MEQREVRDDDPNALARELRLQEIGKTRPTSIDDPLIEPAWLGPRVVAAVAGDRETAGGGGCGEPFDERPEVAAALARAMGPGLDEGAIFEGYLSKQLAPEGVGARHGVTA